MRRRAWLSAALAAAACAPDPVLPSPPDPPGAIADAAIPFADPYRAELIDTAARLTRTLREQGADCLATRVIRVPAPAAPQVTRGYAADRGWSPVDALSSRRTIGLRQGAAWFVAEVADRPQRGWTGVVIVTNSVWDDASRDELARCRSRGG